VKPFSRVVAWLDGVLAHPFPKTSRAQSAVNRKLFDAFAGLS
jgi:hypothetical protein